MKNIAFDVIPQLTKTTEFNVQVSWSDGYDTTVRLYSETGFMLEGVILGCCKDSNILMVTHAYANVVEAERNKDIVDTIDATGSVKHLWGKPHWKYHRTIKYKTGDVIAFNRHEYTLDEEY